MKPEQFEATPEFVQFKEVMRGVISVSKKRLDELLKKERRSSKQPRKKVPKRQSH